MKDTSIFEKKILKIIILNVFLFLLMGSANAQIVINEGSNKNYQTLMDEDGDYEDWIEIYNAGTTAVDLFNFSLSDNSTPGEWVFPHQIIEPNKYLIILCSGKNRNSTSTTSAFTHVLSDTMFTPQGGWNMGGGIVGGWNVHQFTTPFYWDGLSNVIVNICSFSNGWTENSIHLQSQTNFNSTTYNVLDGTSACNLSAGFNSQQRPNIRLNNVVIGTGILQNSPTDYPAPYGNYYWSARHQLLFKASELIAAGLTQGNINSLAFNVLSTGATQATYSFIDLSMAKTNLTELTSNFLPTSGAFYHTNFKISSNGETIKLYNPSNVLVSSLNVNCGQGIDVSIGSITDASTTIKKFSVPTPGSTNNVSIPADTYVSPPSFSVNGGIYTTPISVSITNSNSPIGSVYYTLDGSDPDNTSQLWNGTPIPIFNTTILRARAYANGYIPSAIVSASYLLNVSHVTPIISVVTDPDNLYGAISGMFDNPALDLLKPASIEYFDANPAHTLIHTGKAGIMMDGGWGSRNQPQRPFRVNLDQSVLGDGPILHNIIPDRPNRNQYGDFFLRNGSNNYLRLPYKDAAQVKMMGDGSNNYYSAWRPVTVYINGSYWGLYELREKTNIEMFQLAENANPNTVEILSSTSQYGFTLRAIEGSVQSFYTSYDNFLQLNPTNTDFWDQADQYFDMKYYNDYIIGEIWIDNLDWAFVYNNLKLYRSNATNFRWRYLLTDLDFGLHLDIPEICDHNLLAELFQADPNNPHLNIWLQGIQNDRFKNYFINRFADLMNSLFLPSRLLEIENSMYNQTVVEMAKEYERWGNPNDVPGQLNEFNQTHLNTQSQLLCRTEKMRNQIQSEFSLPQQVDVALDVYPANTGKINISTITPEVYPWSGVYFDGVPIKIEAQAQPGYEFSHWESNGLITDTLNPVFLGTLQTNNTLFRAHFASTLGVNNLASGSFSIFPNPSSDKIRIKHSDSSKVLEELTFIDLLGRKINQPFSVTENNEVEVDVSSFASGYYVIYYLSKEGKSFNTPFIKL